ncbi:MAG: hypothetical protein ACRC41_08695 [Sarcina sp.]
MADKKIYEELNNIKVDIEERSLDTISKKRIQKKLQKKIGGNHNNKFKYFVAASFMMVCLPITYEAISEVKKHFFYETGIGLIEQKADRINTLRGPITFGSSKEFVLKNAMWQNNGLELGIWIKNSISINKENIYIKTNNGEKIQPSITGEGSGGQNIYLNLFFEINNEVKNFEFFIENESIQVELLSIDSFEDYSDFGLYANKRDIILGGSKYEIDNRTYISFWNNIALEYKNIVACDIDKNDVRIKDKKGNRVNFQNSIYNGSQTEFVLDKLYNEQLDVLVNKIHLEYKFNDNNKLEISLPKKNTKEFINENLNLKSFGDIKIISIEDINGVINVEIDATILNKNGLEVNGLGMQRNGSGAIGSDGKSNCVISIDRGDLTLNEKINNKLKLTIDRINCTIKDDWEFMIE